MSFRTPQRTGVSPITSRASQISTIGRGSSISPPTLAPPSPWPSSSPITAVRSRWLDPHRVSSPSLQEQRAARFSWGRLPGITGTVNAISIASGLIVISGNASITSGTGDAIDLTATGGTQAAPANLSINLTGPITGAASGVAAVQNAYGSITVNTSGPVIGLAGRGIYATQSATGVGSILINGSGNVTGTGTDSAASSPRI